MSLKLYALVASSGSELEVLQGVHNLLPEWHPVLANIIMYDLDWKIRYLQSSAQTSESNVMNSWADDMALLFRFHTDKWQPLYTFLAF